MILTDIACNNSSFSANFFSIAISCSTLHMASTYICSSSTHQFLCLLPSHTLVCPSSLPTLHCVHPAGVFSKMVDPCWRRRQPLPTAAAANGGHPEASLQAPGAGRAAVAGECAAPSQHLCHPFLRQSSRTGSHHPSSRLSARGDGTVGLGDGRAGQRTGGSGATAHARMRTGRPAGSAVATGPRRSRRQRRSAARQGREWSVTRMPQARKSGVPWPGLPRGRRTTGKKGGGRSQPAWP
ncbi:hypothetical protein BS78_06G047300 [Paspalum vaginatum]|nr:hypothetical protein BS78_06G047300 [Paspalum vaginatum]